MNRILGHKEEIWDPAKISIVPGNLIAYLKGPSLNMGCIGRRPPVPYTSSPPGTLGPTLCL